MVTRKKLPLYLTAYLVLNQGKPEKPAKFQWMVITIRLILHEVSLFQVISHKPIYSIMFTDAVDAFMVILNICCVA